MANDESKLIDLEQRIIKLEKAVFGKKSKQTFQKNQEYSGLSGAIQLLIDNNFLSKPKDIPEIVSELKRENYHYPTESVRVIVARDFTKKRRILTRITENKKYKYVIRK